MNQQEQHTMELVKSFETGAEEWRCPACDRRFIVQWPPRYKKIILFAGNEYALHSGGKGGLQMHHSPPQQTSDDHLSPEWRSALEDLDFGEWPDESE